ncbi:MAG: hypothetical protein SFT81_06980 [Candidatus Caenarcaniphilales bacterium]|nr:hypothetical protein [Candidatus Caenarcaniphilales bacterium]
MDLSKIGGMPNIPPDKSIQPKTKSDDLKAARKSGDAEKSALSAEEQELGEILSSRLSPAKVVKMLSKVLEKSVADPKIEKLLNEYKIPPNSRQALALCAYTCVKDTLNSKLNVSSDEEQKILEAIQTEYEKDAHKEPIDPNERKKRKRERRKKNKAKVNALLQLIEDTLKNLEREKGSLSLQS